MYDDFDDYHYPAEDNYHEETLLHEAEDFYNEFYSDDDHDYDPDANHSFQPETDPYSDLLDELEYPF